MTRALEGDTWFDKMGRFRTLATNAESASENIARHTTYLPRVVPMRVIREGLIEWREEDIYD